MAYIVSLDVAGPNVLEWPDSRSDSDLRDFYYKKLSCSFLECVACPDQRYILLVDESGRLKNLPVNAAASLMYAGALKKLMYDDMYYIYGDVVVLSRCVEKDGSYRCVPFESKDEVHELLRYLSALFKAC